MEGGMRVPMIARWPGNIPAGSMCGELTTTMDFLPTFSSLAGAELPMAKLDGFDIRGLLTADADAVSPYECFYYYRRRQLQAVRWKHWKYHLPLAETHPRWTSPNPVGKGRKGKLVNLMDDLQEKKDVSKEHPDVMKRMKTFIANATAELGNDASLGTGQRQALTLDASKPMHLID